MQPSKSLFGAKSNGFNMHDSAKGNALFSPSVAATAQTVLDKAGYVDTVRTGSTGSLNEPYYHMSLRNKQAYRYNSTKAPAHQISDDLLQIVYSKNIGASLYGKAEEKAKDVGETYETQGDFLFRDANKSPEERRAVQRIRQPLSPMIYHLLREKEREAKVIAYSKPTPITPIQSTSVYQATLREAPAVKSTAVKSTGGYALATESLATEALATVSAPGVPLESLLGLLSANKDQAAQLLAMVAKSSQVGKHDQIPQADALPQADYPALVASRLIPVVAVAQVTSSWPDAVFAFDDSDAPPHIDDWSAPSCAHAAALSISDGDTVTLLVDASTEQWARLVDVSQSGHCSFYWVPLFDNNGDSYFGSIMSIASYATQYADTIVQSTAAYYQGVVNKMSKEWQQSHAQLEDRIQVLEELIDSLSKKLDSE